MNQKQEGVFVGIDVAKDTLEVAVRPSGERETFANTEEGIPLMEAFIKRFTPVLIVCEATGSFETRAVTDLAASGLPVVVVNARQVRDFARATGILAKTDKIDARVIAHFADAVRPDVRPLKDREAQRLDALLPGVGSLSICSLPRRIASLPHRSGPKKLLKRTLRGSKSVSRTWTRILQIF